MSASLSAAPRPPPRLRRTLCALAAAGLALLLGAPTGGDPAPAAPPTPADSALTEAQRLYTVEGPRPALPAFERALALYRGAGDRHGEARTLGYIGIAA